MNYSPSTSREAAAGRNLVISSPSDSQSRSHWMTSRVVSSTSSLLDPKDSIILLECSQKFRIFVFEKYYIFVDIIAMMLLNTYKMSCVVTSRLHWWGPTMYMGCCVSGAQHGLLMWCHTVVCRPKMLPTQVDDDDSAAGNMVSVKWAHIVSAVVMMMSWVVETMIVFSLILLVTSTMSQVSPVTRVCSLQVVLDSLLWNHFKQDIIKNNVNITEDQEINRLTRW